MAVGHTLHHRILGIKFLFITANWLVFRILLNNFFHLSMMIANFCVILTTLARFNYTRFLIEVLIVARAVFQRRSLTPTPTTVISPCPTKVNLRASPSAPTPTQRRIFSPSSVVSGCVRLSRDRVSFDMLLAFSLVGDGFGS